MSSGPRSGRMTPYWSNAMKMVANSILGVASAAVALAPVSAWAQMPPERTPLDILRERFARGEIDKEEFDQRRRVLGE